MIDEIMNNVDKLLSHLDKSQLADFIRKECMSDSRFQDRFLALGAGALFKPDPDTYAYRVKDLIYDYGGRHGYIKYRDTFDFNRAVSRIIDEASAAIDNGLWEVATAVLTGVSSVSEDILNSGDDSAGELGAIVSECFEKWHELIACESLPENLKSEIFELALSQFNAKELKDWDWWWDWIGMASKLADTQDKQQEVIKALDAIQPDGDDWSAKHNAQTAQRYKLEIMSRQGNQEDQLKFLYGHVSNPDFRRKLLKMAWDKADFDEVLRLAQDGVVHDTDYVGLVNEWHRWEYKVYCQLNDKQNQIKSAHYFFFQRNGIWGDKGFSMEAMYGVLKSLIPQNEWPQYVETLINEAKGKGGVVQHILFIFTQEKIWPEYMEYLRKNPSLYNIGDAPKEVKELFKNEIIKLYASEVKSFFQRASDRKSYNYGVEFLRTLIEYGGNKEAEQIIEEQRSRTPRRPALIDELSKL